MPYILPDLRTPAYLKSHAPEGAGELNYRITLMLLDYLEHHGKSYRIINDIMGAIEGAKFEFYRRVAAPYEDKKCHINGDVY